MTEDLAKTAVGSDTEIDIYIEASGKNHKELEQTYCALLRSIIDCIETELYSQNLIIQGSLINFMGNKYFNSPIISSFSGSNHITLNFHFTAKLSDFWANYNRSELTEYKFMLLQERLFNQIVEAGLSVKAEIKLNNKQSLYYSFP